MQMVHALLCVYMQVQLLVLCAAGCPLVDICSWNHA